MKLRTIGYEAATQGAVIDCLKGACVEVVIDVRAVASSRRAGFSKTILAASLAEAGIDYVHQFNLTTRRYTLAEMEAIFEAHLQEPEAQLQLAEALDIARERSAALLCYEADALHCHRRIVAGRLAQAETFEVEDLRP